MTSDIDQTHSLTLESWVQEANGHPDFPIQNLPLGIFSPNGGIPRAGVAIGDHVLDLTAILSILPEVLHAPLRDVRLNRLFAMAAEKRRELRHILSIILSESRYREALLPALHHREQCEMHLPATIGDYTDFYVGIHHATNVGRLFRPDNPLLPNYKYVPIGYHGRASSVLPSGIDVVRPSGQAKGGDQAWPSFGPSKRLDYELELGIWIGRGNELGEPIPIERANEHIAGFCLLNDWSARDFQAWEYMPLGPFLAKNFHSTISPWVITPEALAPFRVAQPSRESGDPRPLPYLWNERDQSEGAFAIDLSVSLSSQAMRDEGLEPFRLSEGPARNMYWTAAQIVTHHASNGCNLNGGDLLGTGTISGPQRDACGSLLEITRGGSDPIMLPSGEQRAFLEDGDEIILSASASALGYVTIGFGECRARILPARRS